MKSGGAGGRKASGERLSLVTVTSRLEELQGMQGRVCHHTQVHTHAPQLPRKIPFLPTSPNMEAWVPQKDES